VRRGAGAAGPRYPASRPFTNALALAKSILAGVGFERVDDLAQSLTLIAPVEAMAAFAAAIGAGIDASPSILLMRKLTGCGPARNPRK
jgi:hypothetical protein